MSKTWEGRIYTKVGGAAVTVTVSANDSTQAKKLIEMRPEFKSWSQFPRQVK
jgi:hypothetical protein